MYSCGAKIVIMNKPNKNYFSRSRDLARARQSERGNILLVILLAIVLIGLLTAAIQQTNNSETSNIDDENLAIRASEIQRYGGELERAVAYIMQSGKSEADLRFAHPDGITDYGDLSADADPTDQVFHKSGGAANYVVPADDVLVTAGTKWEFYGGTHIPGVGSSKPDLVAVLPNVTKQFCDKINALNGLDSTQPLDTGGSNGASGTTAGSCINLLATGRFANTGNSYKFFDSPGFTPNTMDDSSFAKIPALQACVQCSGIAGAPYHFYHVLMAR